MEVSIEMARLFKDQYIGTHNGHMAEIPNNPVLRSIFMAMSKTGFIGEDFPDLIIAIGNALKKEQF